MSTAVMKDPDDVDWSRPSGSLPRSKWVSGERTGDEMRALVPVRPGLHKLVDLQGDRLDLSIVEKLIVSQDGVIGLCNDLVAGSAGQREGRPVLDFDSLNRRAVHVVGLYGSKDVLLKIFEHLELGVGDGRGLKTGIYCVFSRHILYIFYWHQGERMGEASRKDVSCNFVRYVVELCETVYVCLDDEDLKTSLNFTSVPAYPASPKRTGKYTIAGRAASAKDFDLRNGYHIHPELLEGGNASATYFLENQSCCISGELKFMLSEGLHRSAVLVPVLCPPRKVRCMQETIVKVKELPVLVRLWSEAHNLSFSELPLEDFLVLLMLGKLNRGLVEAYRSLASSFELRRAEHKQKFYQLEEALWEEEKALQVLVKRAVMAYRRLSFQWEERTLATDSHGDSPRPSETDDEHELVRVEKELCMFWSKETDSEANSRAEAGFLFVGSEFCLVDMETDDPVQIVGFGPAVFVVESVSTTSSKWAGPVLLSNVFVGRLLKEGPGTDICWTMQVLPSDGECPEGPIIASSSTTRTIRLQFGRQSSLLEETEYPDQVQIRLKAHTSRGMLEWMQMYGKDTILPQLRRADVLSYVCAYPEEFGVEISRAAVLSVKQTLDSASPSGHFRAEFSNQKIAQLLGKSGFEDQQVEHRSDVIEACKAVYIEDCRTLCAKVESMIRKDVLPLLREHRRLQLEQQARSLEKCFEREESDFARMQKMKAGGDKPGLSRLSISRCGFPPSARMAGQLSNGVRSNKLLLLEDANLGEEKVALQTFQEETEQAQVTWSIAELAPTKKDVDESRGNAAHIIVPQLSLHHKLINLDLSSEKLSKVITLRSGAVLVFVEDMGKTLLQVYLCPNVGADLTGAKPIRTFKRFDLYAFDEVSNYLALYDQTLGKVGIYKYDELSRHIDSCDVELSLAEYSGSKDLTCILFIPGKKEVLLIDTDCRVRVFEITYSAMIKPRAISLPGPPTKICVTHDGSCLLAVYVGSSSSGHTDPYRTRGNERRIPQGHVQVEVYTLEDAFSYLKTVELDLMVQKGASLDAAVIKFESQMHLLVVDTSKPSMGIVSKLVVNGSNGPELQELRKSKTSRARLGEDPYTAARSRSCHALDYIGQIFEKFATSPPLMKRTRDVVVHILMEGQSEKINWERHHLKDQNIQYVQSLLERVRQDRGKDFSKLQIQLRSDTMGSYLGAASQHLRGSRDSPAVPVGTWMQQLVCLVPIQIARAENNSLRALSDGLQLPASVNYADAMTLANVVHFGLYDAVLGHWKGNIKVISSMGKQSSGKSYLLNHLSGSFLDVAGGRCTDGVWMTMRATDSCLYVLLDFEGVGSFERSEQEDMLLSLLNAALSNITIFNKKDFHMDKETEASFQRFQDGINLAKQDSHLFRGLFYLAIKDVDTDDVEDLKDEFYSKISQICHKSEENFITKMYGGHIEIAAMPPFQTSDFHESVADVAMTVEDLEVVYNSGKKLGTDLKLMIAQLSAKDWSPIETKRVALKVGVLRKHLNTAVCSGKLLQGEGDCTLVNVDTLEAVADDSIQLGDHAFVDKDTNLELLPCRDSQVVSNILRALKSRFVRAVPRTRTDDESWHSKYEAFVEALASRRERRVLAWLDCNTQDFQNEGEVQTLRLQANAMLADLKQGLSLCGSKCSHCFLRCGLERSHPHGHDCLEKSHQCAEPCTFCCEGQETKHMLNECGDLNGHDGPHDCKGRDHSCGKECSFATRSSNCNGVCAMLPNHAGDHRCNTTHHLCMETCSLPSCNHTCTFRLELGNHERHACSEQICPVGCSFQGCGRTCGAADHFHDLALNSRHICGYEHTCYAECDSPGICEVVTELTRHSKTFAGRRSVFQYEHLTEQSAVRHRCSIAIPAGKDTHEGPHRHTEKADAVHFCETRCTACGYFCHLPMGHSGLHDTTHGNMRDLSFVAEVEDIDLQERKYSWGESGMAELCMMYCKAQGRGHLHLVKCRQPFGKCGETLYDGVRHESRKYGPNFDEPKDEFTHAAYWKHMRFKDPCQPEDRIDFGLCNHFCRSEEHASHTDRKYCTGKLWHRPFQSTDEYASRGGCVTEDGHSFLCRHARGEVHHLIFIIDRSGSMASEDVKPTLASISKTHNNRLGCVYEAMIRFISGRNSLPTTTPDSVSVILFNSLASRPVDRQHIREFAVDRLLAYRPGGRTDYSSGLLLAKTLLHEAAKDKLMKNKSPVVVFLSDGANYGRINPLPIIEEMRQLEPSLVLHTILFGKDEAVDLNLLDNMAKAANGTFKLSIDEVQLAKSFEDLARSLRPKVISLM